MRPEDLTCKYCNAQLQIKEDGSAECPFCQSRYQVVKEDGVEAYRLEPLLEYGNRGQAAESSGKDMPVKKKHSLVLLASVFIVCIMLCGVALYSGIRYDKNKEVSMQSSAEGPVEEATEAMEDTDYLPKTQAFQQFLKTVYNKRLSKITKEEVEAIKYLRIYFSEEWDEIVFEYSFGDYYANDNSYNEHMDEIYLEKDSLTSYSDLACFTGLTDLEVEYGKLEKEDVAPLVNLRAFACQGTPSEAAEMISPERLWYLGLHEEVTSLEGIEQFTNLESLALINCPVSSLAPLASLSELYSLTIRDCDEITDFSALDSMISLESLVLDTDGLESIEFVSKMPFLGYLSLEDTMVSDIGMLEDNQTLYYLDLTGNDRLYDYSPVSTMTALNTLILAAEESFLAPDLSGLTNLTQLWIKGEADLSALRGLSDLQLLILEEISIPDTSVFDNLTKLVSLRLGSIQGDLTNLDFLENLTSLLYLDLSQNDFKFDISVVFGLPNLETLYLDKTNFGLDASKIKENTALRTLTMNQIKIYDSVQVIMDVPVAYDLQPLQSKLTFFDSLPSLEYLELRSNRLTTLDNLLPLTRLQCLVIDDNDIYDISILSGFPELYAVYCSDNPIKVYGDVEDTIWVIE